MDRILVRQSRVSVHLRGAIRMAQRRSTRRMGTLRIILEPFVSAVDSVLDIKMLMVEF